VQAGQNWGEVVSENEDPGAEHTGNEARASSMDKVYYACAILAWKTKETECPQPLII
jgi:hypothetical protein